ncbi:MAG: GAF domain-containing sensor histidine kinase [Armatimonadota bacterium]|nr:GAF domain-containing sensor histidine kinase [Armatimonadota bacterium]MDR7449684.1 GAF domain-containing sensor histidine kinase [Armatimonadota bacterium]MDR7458400.1 GAF domain-containing sensor histidine kinase [Armatimonadota bacterium]MDR7478797.1 GAF domain-containing sensor histidine kinase [Armatimonadota bacterium]MDR7488820.1 GAF domain-containing sensor histidine kinase [Armatimonadota bacterium]
MLIPLLALGFGLLLAATAFLVFRYLESREQEVRWWAIAFTLFTGHVVAEGLAFAWPAASLVRHLLFLFAAGAMARSFGPVPWPLTPLLGVVAVVAAALLLPSSVWLAALPPSVVAGLWFFTAAVRYARFVGGLDERSSRLVAGGMVLEGLVSLSYPLLRPHPVGVGVGAVVSGLAAIMLGLGVLMRAWARARDLATITAVAETLNRSADLREALTASLSRVVELMGLRGGWIFLQEDEGEFALAASHRLPEPLMADGATAMRGDCRCLQMLREGQLRRPVNLVACLRLERVGWLQPRHASIPLHTAERVIGVMNLLLSPGRNFSGRELDLLAATGHEMALAAERTRLLAEVRAKEAARGELIERLLTAQEEERRRIARELHDEAGQALTALILNLEMAGREAAEPDATRLRRLKGIAEQTLGELRRLIYDLRPTVLDDLGLGAAVRWYVREVVEPSGLAVTLDLQGVDRRLPPPAETALFRILQEALNNVLKHAAATRVSVALHVGQDAVRLTVSDDGRGFEVGRPPARPGGGLGLLGMRERAELLGGQMHVRSAPGQGTTIEVVLPPDSAPEPGRRQ